MNHLSVAELYSIFKAMYLDGYFIIPHASIFECFEAWLNKYHPAVKNVSLESSEVLQLLLEIHHLLS